MSKKCTPLWRGALLEAKMLKHHMFGPLLDVELWILVILHFAKSEPNRGFPSTCKKLWQAWGVSRGSGLRCTTLHYTTRHYTPLHFTSLHCTTTTTTIATASTTTATLHYTKLQLHYTTLNHTTLHCTTLHYTYN